MVQTERKQRKTPESPRGEHGERGGLHNELHLPSPPTGVHPQTQICLVRGHRQTRGALLNKLTTAWLDRPGHRHAPSWPTMSGTGYRVPNWVDGPRDCDLQSGKGRYRAMQLKVRPKGTGPKGTTAKTHCRSEPPSRGMRYIVAMPTVLSRLGASNGKQRSRAEGYTNRANLQNTGVTVCGTRAKADVPLSLTPTPGTAVMTPAVRGRNRTSAASAVP